MKTLCSAGIALALLNCLPGFAATEAELPGLTERRADWAGHLLGRLVHRQVGELGLPAGCRTAGRHPGRVAPARHGFAVS